MKVWKLKIFWPNPMHRGQNIQDKEWFQIIMIWVGVESPKYSLEQCGAPWILESAPFFLLWRQQGSPRKFYTSLFRSWKLLNKKDSTSLSDMVSPELGNMCFLYLPDPEIGGLSSLLVMQNLSPYRPPKPAWATLPVLQDSSFPSFLNNTKKVTGK